MKERRCSLCRQVFEEDELLVREDTGERVCEDCSGLWSEEGLSCCYDEG